jgi:hypothetical protein
MNFMFFFNLVFSIKTNVKYSDFLFEYNFYLKYKCKIYTKKEKTFFRFSLRFTLYLLHEKIYK